MSYLFYKKPTIADKLFPKKVELLSSVNELFELELAYLEYNTIAKKDLLQRTAYIKSVDGKLSNHYLMYSGEGAHLIFNRSSLSKSYFTSGQFSTGYATHGLFPYRGKFHPQLIKAILNIIGVKRGDNVLDPMCGSGTTNIEAALLGINSYAVDISPFCQFMTKVKYESMSIDTKYFPLLESKENELFSFYNSNKYAKHINSIDTEKQKVYNLALLAFYDALGYSYRVENSSHQELFKKVLNRYIATIKNFIPIRQKYIKNLGKLQVLNNSSALSLQIDDNIIDGVITSPPYSFAINYIENDTLQLKRLNVNLEELKNKMIGLHGKNKSERLANYFSDMDSTCKEISRVLKPGKYFVMIIGSNTNQTGGIRLEESIIKSCRKYGLSLVKSVLKPIKGMRNTMKDEYVLFFRKGDF